MSVVSLHEGDKGPVSLEKLHEVAKNLNFKIPQKDENDYLVLLNAADSAIQQVNNIPEFIDSRLSPELSTSGERKFWRPPAHDNPLGAWSHRSVIEASPSLLKSSLLKSRTVCFKDNISVGGLPLTGGTFPELLWNDSKHAISIIDASVVSRVLQAGATVLGTATCENYSMCALSYSSASGPVHNPWLKGYNTGGSSSGCAALVAIAKVKEWKAERSILQSDDLGKGCDMAVGGDQGGSIRLPAAYTGVYGLKPTHGLVPYTGIMSLHPLIDHCGPIANSVYDIARLLSVLAGYDGIDPRMTPETPLRTNVKDYFGILDDMVIDKKKRGEWKLETAALGLRVGIVPEAWQFPGIDPQVASIVRTAAERFRAVGATVKEVSIPLHAHGPAIWTAATRFTMPHYATRNHTLPLLSYPLPNLSPPPPTQEMYDLLSHHNPAVINVMLNSAYLNQQYGPSFSAKAMMHVHQLRAAYDTAFEKFDVLITPVNPTVGMPHPNNEDGVLDRMKLAIGNTSNTCPFNATGHPALSMPVGWAKVKNGEGKLPVGMQVVGRRWDEETILKAALAWEVAGEGLNNES